MSWPAVMPLVGAVAVVVGCAARLRRRRVSAREAVPAGVAAGGYLSVLVISVAWCAGGLYEGDVPSLAILTLVAVVGAASALFRPELRMWLDRHVGAWDPPRRRVAVALVLLAVTVAASCALELPWNPDYLSAGRPFQLVELAMLMAVAFALWLLARRHGAGLVALVVICAAIGIAQYFIMRFKEVAILPSDLFALRTALSVSGSYTYAVGPSVVAGLVAACVGTMLTWLPGAVLPPAMSRRLPSRDALVGLATIAALVAFVSVPSFIDDLGLELMYFSSYSLESYRENGFIPAFVAAVQNIGIKRPQGYSDEQAVRDEEALVAAYDDAAANDGGRVSAARAQFERERPTIIAIMNESFADLSQFDVLEQAGYGGLTYLSSIDDALARGSLAVSVLGGGTCNTEFEFLTGNSYAFVGEGKYPFVMYQLAPFDNLARQLSSLGYTCSALHPNDAANWNRDLVYASMGFDRFYSIEDFAGAPLLHSGVSDAATYDKILELLASDDAPQFVFDVTMQNHSGYDQHNMPADLVRHYGLERYADDAWTSDAIDEYLACVEASDQALERFVRELADLGRPVALVFFGDHHPHISAWINDDLYDDALELDHIRRVHLTPYLMWANYDVAGAGGDPGVAEPDDSSPDVLGAMLLDLVGAPLTSLQKARLAARRDIPALAAWGYEGADRVWYAPDEDSPYRATYDALARINYHCFGSHV